MSFRSVTSNTLIPAGASAQQIAASIGTWYVIAKSATQVTLTGTLVETVVATIPIPANSLGPNGVIRVTGLFTYTNTTALVKSFRYRFGGITGDVFRSSSQTAAVSLRDQGQFGNRGTSVQVGGFAGGSGGFGSSSAGAVIGAKDTTLPQDLVITLQNADVTDVIRMESYIVELSQG